MADDPTDTPPDRLSLDPRSPYYDETIMARGVGITFNGQEKTNVIEYSISEGWIRVAAGRSRDRYGQPMTIKLKGEVEPFFSDSKEAKDEAASTERAVVARAVLDAYAAGVNAYVATLKERRQRPLEVIERLSLPRV